MWVLVLMVELVIPLCLISRLPLIGVTCRIYGMEIPIIATLSCLLYLYLFGKQLYGQWL